VSEQSPAVVFIGAPASGKTRIGKRVAKSLDLPFVDTDARIVAAHGPIPAIFEQYGEPRFREFERAEVARALTERAVVSLGGGAVLDERTQRDLASVRVVLLTTSPDAVATRLDNEKRPLLKDGVDAWVRLVEARRPIYERLATRTWDTSSRPIQQIADEIAEWVRDGNGAGPTETEENR